MARPFWSPFPVYVTASERRARATAHLAGLAGRVGKKGAPAAPPEPVVIDGRQIARTFWGKAWCDNLESYADFAYRLGRGRSYVRSGAVVDLRIQAGKVDAHVSGSDLYTVAISIAPLARPRWKAIASACAGKIGSLVGLLRGELPDEIMKAVTDRETGLFPAPRQIRMSCSCPDVAGVCKHVAASLYGVGARLDARPALLFLLRAVEAEDLVHEAAGSLPDRGPGQPSTLVASDADLGAMFGIELREEPVTSTPRQRSSMDPAAPKRGTPSRKRRPPAAKLRG
jgi:uncharacterized Zn finger protein